MTSQSYEYAENQTSFGAFDGRIDGAFDGRINGALDGRIDGALDGRTDGSLDGSGVFAGPLGGDFDGLFTGGVARAFRVPAQGLPIIWCPSSAAPEGQRSICASTMSGCCSAQVSAGSCAAMGEVIPIGITTLEAKDRNRAWRRRVAASIFNVPKRRLQDEETGFNVGEILAAGAILILSQFSALL